MKAFFRRAIAVLMAGVMGGAVLTGCGSSTTVDGSKTVMTVNDEKVRLGVLSFYARYYQSMMTSYYGAMAQQQGGGMFDQSTADSSDKSISTYGQALRKNVVDDLEQMVVISQHASDKKYKISLTSDQKKKIKAVAKAYITDNSKEVRDKIGATQDDVEKLLELQTIKSSMMDPMVKNVSTKVSQKESQQSTVTYVSVAADTSGTSSSATSSSGATSSSQASSSTSSTSAKTSKKAARAKAKATAQKVLDAMKTQSSAASADMDSVAKSVDSSLSAVNGNYTTNNTTDGTVDSSIVKAVKGLSDGTLVDHVVQSKNKNNYYVVRFDKTNDAESTSSKKESIISTRKQTAYEKLVKQWVKKADIKVNNRVLKTLTITDHVPYTLKSESSASSTTASAASGTSSTALAGTTSSASSSSSAASSTGSTAASTASGTASGTASASSAG